jgi:hypothetical protein
MTAHPAIPLSYPTPVEIERLRALVSASGELLLDALFGQWAAERRALLSRAECMRLGGWAQTRQIAMEESGVLPSFLDGPNRRIPVPVLYRYLIECVLSSHPADAPSARVREPPKRFLKGHHIGRKPKAAKAGKGAKIEQPEA